VGLLVYFFGALVANPTLPRLVLLFAPAMFTSGLVFILTVQIPDLEADSSAGKPTWVRSLGRRKAFAAILVLTLANAIYYIALALLTDVAALDFRIVALISLAPVIPAAIAVIQRVESAKRATRFVGAVMTASIFVTVCFNAYLLILRMV
jgi:1,4-dihydroxy-2-naphthoate octaprenyltransferase